MSRVGTAFVLLIALVVAVGTVPIPALPATDPDSASLTEYLHNHKLPAVGAQITVGEDGARTVMLYGFVATQRGHDNAEKRTRSFLNDPYVRIVNRIKIEPELLALGKSGSQSTASGDNTQSADNVPPSVADNTPPPSDVGDIQQYQSQNPAYYDPYAMAGQGGTSVSGSSLLIPLLGGLILYGAMGGLGSPGYSPPPTYHYPQPQPRPYYPPPPRHHHRGGLSPNLFTPPPAPLYTPHVASMPHTYRYTPPPAIRYTAPPTFSSSPSYQHSYTGGYHGSYGVSPGYSGGFHSGGHR